MNAVSFNATNAASATQNNPFLFNQQKAPAPAPVETAGSIGLTPPAPAGAGGSFDSLM